MAHWIKAAREGDTEAMGLLLAACRQFLLLVANQQLPANIQGKVGASDLVQETFIKAQGNLERFRGESEEELLAWLRKILVHVIVDTTRHYRGTDKREVGREVALDAEATTKVLGRVVRPPKRTPSSQAIAREAESELKLVLGELPELYRQVIHWRNWERRPFGEIGQLTGRSADAARQLWKRALEHLARVLEPDHES
jgi:RNA polymerase sigma-70 factor (ECF subfamily)